MSRWIAGLLVALLAVAGCGAGEADPRTPHAREGRAGLHLTGTLDGRQVAVADGLPNLVVGDCDPMDGPDEDVCFISRTIDGSLFVLVFENPAVMAAGETLEVRDVPCARPAACDQVDEAALVDVQLDTSPRWRAIGGSVTFTLVEPGERYAGEVRLDLPRGRLSGTFDVIPRPE